MSLIVLNFRANYTKEINCSLLTKSSKFVSKDLSNALSFEAQYAAIGARSAFLFHTETVFDSSTALALCHVAAKVIEIREDSMIDRRTMIGATLASAATAPACVTTWANAQDAVVSQASFDALLKNTIEDNELRSEGANRYERQEEDSASIDDKGLADRVPSPRSVAKRAFDLIVGFEVSSPAAYEANYRRPIRPGGLSGVTIGVGYDIGYVNEPWLVADWSGFLQEEDINKLKVACRKTGSQAENLKASLQSVSIPWVVAKEQFEKRTLPLYIAETEENLRNTSKLSAESLGALVSLVYNRGASFKKTTEHYAEMRNIRLYMAQEKFDLIPNEFISMQRIWRDKPNMRGLLRRRELEAKLFQSGLSS